MFRLSERRGDSDGPYCGPEGLYLGSIPLIAKLRDAYHVRRTDEIAALIAAAYGSEADVARLLPGLHRVAAALQHGDIVRAMIAAVQLRLGEIPEERLLRIAQVEALLKDNFNPDEPRVPAGNPDGGQWTAEDGGDGGENGNRGGDGQDGRTDSSPGGEADSGDAGSRTEGKGRSEPPPASYERVWERFPNADFRNQLAIAERSANPADFGYGDLNPSSGALGRYQFTRIGLEAAGMMDREGRWTGKYGIYSAAQFLASPEAQEMALTDLLSDTERQLRANGAFDYVGTAIDGRRARFTITRAGLIAAGHREGARETRAYLRELENSGFSSVRARLSADDLRVETRLRTFAGIPYD